MPSLNIFHHRPTDDRTNVDTELDLEKPDASYDDDSPIRVFRPRILAMAVIVSLGGLIFGYDTGQ